MSYTIKLSNGQILVTLADQQLDTVSSSLTLIGKNVNAYGDDINTNFVRLMENFSSPNQPRAPLNGQIWFNSLDQRLYVYTNSSQFRPISGAIVSPTQPASLSPGDLWINTAKRQLNFFDGTTVVPAFSNYDFSKGKSTLLVEEILDSSGASKTVSNLYSNGVLLGVVSNESFIPSTSLTTSTGILAINKGLSLSPDSKIYGTVTNAEKINGLSPETLIVSTTTSVQTVASQFGVLNDSGLKIGAADDLRLYITGTNRSVVLSTTGPQIFRMMLRSITSASNVVLNYDPENGCLGLFNILPTTPVDIGTNVRIRGNLTVDGTATYVSQVNLSIENKVINLASTSTEDVTAHLGGIILNGSTDKTLLWDIVNTSWNSSEHFNLVSGKSYKINDNTVISETSLGTSITSAPGLTSIGNLTSATIGQVIISTSSIRSAVTGPLILGNGLTTVINVAGRKIVSAATPTSLDTGDTVATKAYVDSSISAVRGGQLVLTMDISGIASSPEDPAVDSFVISYLTILAPPTDVAPYGLANGSRARVLVTSSRSTATSVVSNPVNFGIVSVAAAGTLNPVNAVSFQTGYVVNTQIPSRTIVVSRAVKQYIVSNGAWVRSIVSGNSNTVFNDGTW